MQFYSQSVIKSIMPFDTFLYAKLLKEIYSWIYLKHRLYALTLQIKTPDKSNDFVSSDLKKCKSYLALLYHLSTGKSLRSHF